MEEKKGEEMLNKIHLGSREGDLVLDPFVGSGTTCVSARMWGRKYIGIEREKDYYDIAVARVGEVEKQKKLGDYFQ